MASTRARTYSRRRSGARGLTPLPPSQASPVEPWECYEEGFDHAPLAPPPSGGYIMGGGGGKGGTSWVPKAPRAELLSNEERRWLARHDLVSRETSNLEVLERIQRWDAEIVIRLSRQPRMRWLPRPSGPPGPSTSLLFSADWWTKSMTSSAPRAPSSKPASRSARSRPRSVKT